MPLPGTREKTDKEIQSDVIAEIGRDFRFLPAEVGVEVDDGVVTLTGTVSSYLKLGQAAEITTRVHGVKDVANKLTVGGTRAHDDTQIAKAVRDTLIWDVDVPEEKIDSVVRDGVVTLTGSVDHWEQRKAAVDAVSHLDGVRYVNDHLVVSPAPRGDQQIHDDIKAALRRRLPFDLIDVVVDHGTVTLMGTVPFYGRRTQAELAVWSTTGVHGVANKIVVRG